MLGRGVPGALKPSRSAQYKPPWACVNIRGWRLAAAGDRHRLRAGKTEGGGMAGGGGCLRDRKRGPLGEDSRGLWWKRGPLEEGRSPGQGLGLGALESPRPAVREAGYLAVPTVCPAPPALLSVPPRAGTVCAARVMPRREPLTTIYGFPSPSAPPRLPPNPGGTGRGHIL